jgi:hypothetical protein
MARAHYYVLSNKGAWKVQLDGKDFPFETQKEAMRAAVDAANASGEGGHDAQVLVQGQDGKWRTEWTYGHDPYPPKG